MIGAHRARVPWGEFGADNTSQALPRPSAATGEFSG
jgi:hypothetical protein